MTTIANSASWTKRVYHFVINLIAFSLCYQISNNLSATHLIDRNVALAFERQMPFLEWMIVPYMSSGIFFLWVFLQMKSEKDLKILSQRMLLATVIATCFFLFYPLRFSFIRPELKSPILSYLYDFLAAVDKPYNQLPSLHVAFCVVFWSAFKVSIKQSWLKYIIAVSLFMVAISTLFTYQHHTLDLLSGLILGLMTGALINKDQNQTAVGFHYLIMASITALVGFVAFESWIALYLSISLLLVSIAYWRNNRNFLNKKSGRHSLWIWILYAPYLLGYRLTWLLVQFRERKHPSFTQMSPRLWVGRRLNQQQAQALPKNCFVIDLTPELSGMQDYLQNRDFYLHFPLLDLLTPDTQTLDQISDQILQKAPQGAPLYVHCAMGYSRSKQLARHLLAKNQGF